MRGETDGMSENQRSENRPSRRRDMPVGLWTRCPGCSKMIYKNLVVERGNVCPECDFHFPITSEERINTLCDPDTFVEFLADLSPADPLGFVARRSYDERVRESREKTGLKEACIVGRAEIGEAPVPRPYGRRKARRRIGEGTSNPQPQRASKLLRSRVCFAAASCRVLPPPSQRLARTRRRPFATFERQIPAARSAGPRPRRERAEVQARACASSPYNLHKTRPLPARLH